MEQFNEIDCEALADNPFKLVGKDWMLITAGDRERFNLMTAAWGGLGVLWQRNVAFCFVRPTRYTFPFMEKSDCFTLSFFTDEYRTMLTFCGSKSGKDVNKVAETGLTPVFDGRFIYYDQARLVLQCRKLYTHDLEPDAFLDPAITALYPLKDYHRMYVGEIFKCLRR